MCRKEVQVKFPDGLHARPAGNFVREAAKFTSKINVEKEGKLANGKSIMAVLTLGVNCNDKITITAEGEDQEDAVEALSRLFA